jgi:transcriptional regulator GlxA family with amidase domain
MNGVTVEAQQKLAFAQQADVVLFGSGIYTREIAKNKAILDQLTLDPAKQLIGAQCSGTLLLATLGLLNGLPACTDLTTKPWVIEAGIEVLNRPFIANGNVATAGGCLSSQYLATWVISKIAGQQAAEAAIHYVAPVGEKEQTVARSLAVIGSFIE